MFSDIFYLSTVLPDTVDVNFYDYLRNLNAKEVLVYALPEGTVCFPRIPLLRIEGPLIVVQLLETTFLTLINYARCERNYNLHLSKKTFLVWWPQMRRGIEWLRVR